jgi:outer membrane protein assembly factor BamB
MARLDESGELLWSRHFDQFWSGCAVRQAPDGGFVIATGDALLKTDQNGDSLWAVGLVAEDVEVTPDRSYVVAGRFRGESTLCKLDSTGSILWSRHLGTRPLGATAVAILPGGFVVAGDSIESVVLWKFDRNGELAWRRLQRAAADLCITNVAVAPSGDLFVGGEAAYAGYFARADAQGSLKWQRLLCQYGFSTEILPLADRGCLVAGGDFGCWESGVIWKVDENGGIGPAGPDAGFPDGDGARGGARTAWRARAERLRSAMRGERRVK